MSFPYLKESVSKFRGGKSPCVEDEGGGIGSEDCSDTQDGPTGKCPSPQGDTRKRRKTRVPQTCRQSRLDSFVASGTERNRRPEGSGGRGVLTTYMVKQFRGSSKRSQKKLKRFIFRFSVTQQIITCELT